MSNHWRIIGLFVLAILASGTAAHAQATARYNRVTTAGVQRNSASSSARLSNVARASSTARGVQGAAATGSDALHPFSSQSMAQTQTSGSGVPRFSTQEEEPAPVRQLPQPQSHTYFPSLRPARAIQQPVTLTARSTAIPMHICTPSRSMMMGGGHR
jgi:hypothetical protein